MQLTIADTDRADLAETGLASWKRAAQRALHPSGDGVNRVSVGEDVIAAIACRTCRGHGAMGAR